MRDAGLSASKAGNVFGERLQLQNSQNQSVAAIGDQANPACETNGDEASFCSSVAETIGSDDVESEAAVHHVKAAGGEEASSTTPTSKPTGHPQQFSTVFRLWYSSPELERQFLLSQLPRNSKRIIGFSVIITLLGIYYLILGKGELRLIVAGFAAGMALCLLIEIGVVVGYRRLSAKVEALTNIIEEEEGIAAGSTTANSKKKKSKKGESISEVVLKRTRRNLAARKAELLRFGFAHEIVSILVLITMLVTVTNMYRVRQHECEFRYLTNHHNRESNTECPFKLYSTNIFGVMIPIVLGQPRFFTYVVGIICGAVPLPFIVSFHHTSSAFEPVGIYAILYTVYCLICVLKFIDESIHRRQFESQLTLATQTKALRERNQAFQRFALDITPTHLRRSLSRSSKGHTSVNSSTDASVLVIDIHNVVEFMTSMVPSQSANAIGMFNAAVCEQCGYMTGVHHIRSVGDVNYIIANLFSDENDITGNSAAQKLVMCGLSIVEVAEVPARCAIARGRVAGMPVGKLCIRYDIVGPAVDDATALLQFCPKRAVLVKGDVVATSLDPKAFRVARADSAAINSPLPTRASSPNGMGGIGGGRSKSPSSSSPASSPTPISLSIETAEETLYLVTIGSHEAIALLMDETLQDETSRPESLTSVDVSRVTATVPNEAATADGQGGTEEDLDLTTEKRCCITTYADEDTERALRLILRNDARMPFIICNWFYAAINLLIVVSVADQRRSSMDAYAIVSIILCACCAIVFGVLSHYVKVTGALLEVQVLLSYLASLVSIIATNLARPSAVGDDPSGFVYVYIISASATGGTLKQKLGFQFACTVIFYIASFSFRILYEGVLVQRYPFFLATCVYATILRSQQDRELFTNLTLLKQTLEAVEYTQQVREAIVSALIPEQLRGWLTTETIKQGTLESWGSDQTVVMYLTLSQALQVTSGNVNNNNNVIDLHSQSGSATGMLGVGGSVGVGGVGGTMAASWSVSSLNSADSSSHNQPGGSGSAIHSIHQHHNHSTVTTSITNPNNSNSTTSVEQLRRFLEDVTSAIEDAVQSTTHQRLDIIKMFGNSVFIAGPLSAGPEKKPRERSEAEKRRTDTALLEGVTDALEIIATLLKTARKRDTLNNLRFGAGLAVEEIVHILRLTEYPSYEMLGSAVNTSRALVHAAPTPMPVMTEKMALLYAREVPVEKQSKDVVVCEAESWRMRGIGTMRVCAIRPSPSAEKSWRSASSSSTNAVKGANGGGGGGLSTPGMSLNSQAPGWSVGTNVRTVANATFSSMPADTIIVELEPPQVESYA